MHADRINRVMLTLFGLLVLAAGAAAMAASTGVFGASFSRQVLSDNRVSAYFGDHGGWLWPVIAGGCALIALACLGWMLALLASTDRAGDIIIGRDPEVVLTVTTAPVADLQALHHRIEDEAFAHARQAAGNPSLPIQLDLA